LLRNFAAQQSCALCNHAKCSCKKTRNHGINDTDDNVLISATLLVGTIANVHKRKKKELIKEVSGHVSGSNSVRDEMLAYHSLL